MSKWGYILSATSPLPLTHQSRVSSTFRHGKSPHQNSPVSVCGFHSDCLSAPRAKHGWGHKLPQADSPLERARPSAHAPPPPSHEAAIDRAVWTHILCLPSALCQWGPRSSTCGPRPPHSFPRRQFKSVASTNSPPLAPFMIAYSCPCILSFHDAILLRPPPPRAQKQAITPHFTRIYPALYLLQRQFVHLTSSPREIRQQLGLPGAHLLLRRAPSMIPSYYWKLRLHLRVTAPPVLWPCRVSRPLHLRSPPSNRPHGESSRDPE